MTKQEFDDLQRQLKELGYQYVGGSKPYWWRSIVRRRDRDGDIRSVAMVVYDVCDLSALRDCVDIVPSILISRDTDERIDVKFTAPRLPIDEVEAFAMKLIAFFDENLKQ